MGGGKKERKDRRGSVSIFQKMVNRIWGAEGGKKGKEGKLTCHCSNSSAISEGEIGAMNGREEGGKEEK